MNTMETPASLIAIAAAMSEAEWDRVRAEEVTNQIFLETERYHRVREHVFELVQRSMIRADPDVPLSGMNRVKGRMLTLTGGSGSGKTVTLQRAFQSIPALRPSDGDEIRRPILSINAPDHPSPGAIYGRLLQSIGYPTIGARSGEVLRQRFLAQVQRLGTIVVHIDDCANMTVGQDAFRTRRSAQKVAGCLRGLMEEDFPLSLIISGLEPTLELLEHDEALARRCQQIKVVPVGDGEEKVIGRAIVERAKERSLAFNPSRELIDRLIHGANHQFGLTLELAWHAIGRAENSGATSLEACHFADAYYRRTECDLGLNVFEAADWMRIDTTAIIPRIRHADVPLKRGRK